MRKDYLEIKQLLKAICTNPYLKHYYMSDLCDYRIPDPTKVPDDERIMFSLYEAYKRKITESNRIFAFFQENSDDTVTYIDIETDQIIDVPKKNQKIFEARNKIVYCPDGYNNLPITYYFLEQAIKKDEETAVKRTLKEYGKPRSNKKYLENTVI